MANRPRLVLITGLPGAGKSTVADEAGGVLDAAVLGHDWAMSGLRPYPDIQEALDAMQAPGHGSVGWSVLCALARSELRRGRSVILDGVARSPEIEQCGRLAEEESAKFLLVLVECPDSELHRSRIEGRVRAIPDWHELTWDDVRASASRWATPDHVDLRVDSTLPAATFKEGLVGVLTVE